MQCSFRDLGNGKYQDTFFETMEMPTYLLAFVIAPYQHVKRGYNRVFASPQAIDQGLIDYPLNLADDSVKAFEEYLGIKNPLKKLDHVVVSNKYFRPGGMENWGIIVYK